MPTGTHDLKKQQFIRKQANTPYFYFWNTTETHNKHQKVTYSLHLNKANFDTPVSSQKDPGATKLTFSHLHGPYSAIPGQHP